MTNRSLKLAATSTTSPLAQKRRKEVRINVADCWTEDVEAEIYAPSEKYSKLYDRNGVETGWNRYNRFKLFALVKSAAKVIVEVRFLTEPGAATITSEPLPMAEAVAAQKIVERAAVSWSNVFKIKVTHKRCCERILDIEFGVVWVAAEADNKTINFKQPAGADEYHYKFFPYRTLKIPHVNNLGMHIVSTTSDFIGAHEFGHLIGVPDEYPDEAGSTSVRHIKPDGSLGAHVKLGHKDLNSPAASVMSTKDSFKRSPHHFWNIAIEVQELLSAKFGREVTCAII